MADHGWVLLEGAQRRRFREFEGSGEIGSDPVGWLFFVPLVLAWRGLIGLTRLFRWPPDVHPGDRRIRAGGRSARFDEIDRARLLRVEGRHILLLSATASDAEVEVPLPPAATALPMLVEIVESSTISLPVDRHDPTGRFGRSHSPSSLTKEEALDALQRMVLLDGFEAAES